MTSIIGDWASIRFPSPSGQEEAMDDGYSVVIQRGALRLEKIAALLVGFLLAGY